jgi:hypothetical protein
MGVDDGVGRCKLLGFQRYGFILMKRDWEKIMATDENGYRLHQVSDNGIVKAAITGDLEVMHGTPSFEGRVFLCKRSSSIWNTATPWRIFWRGFLR